MDQIEQAHMELSTFKFLQQQEEAAIPRRIEVSISKLLLFLSYFYFTRI